MVMWLGMVSGSFAITPVTVDIKPFQDGFVMSRDNGMLIWTDTEGNATDSLKLRMQIAGIDVRDDRVLVVSPDCRVMSVERGGRSRVLCRSQIRNKVDYVVGIACSKDNTLILTENGVILSTVDFDSFKSMDFNGTYFTYYDETRFCSISASDNSFFIAGTYPDGMPAVFTSAAGNIWSERSLTYTQGAQTLQLEKKPIRLAYDKRMDRFVLACTEGYLFYMPGCSHCNSMEHKAMLDIVAVGFNDGRCIWAVE